MRVIIQIFLSNFVSAHMKHYSANQVLIGLEENWKKNLDNNKIIGAVFKDLSAIFNCIPDDIPIAKMETYGFREDFLTFFIFIPEASKTTRKHQRCPQYISNSTPMCPTRVHSRTTSPSLQHLL